MNEEFDEYLPPEPTEDPYATEYIPQAVEPADGFQTAEHQYVVDIDYFDVLGCERWEDLIGNKADLTR